MKTLQDKQPPAAGEKLREDLQQALLRFATGPLRESAEELLNTLGYRSERTTDAGSVEEFLNTFDARDKLRPRQLETFDAWRGVEIIFQVTSDEITAQENLFGQSEFDKGLIKSFLFLAVDLETGSYNRTALADMTRSVNRLFDMPVIVLFRHASTMTLSVIHRRVHKRDDCRVVLKKVTLIKDVVLTNPHRAHLDILTDLSMQGLAAAETIRDFDALHNVWESKLDTEELNRRFYRELFEWFDRTSKECRFPNDGAGEDNNERHVIRLITRLLFIWFLKEKGLVPDKIFKQEFAEEALRKYDPDATDYYRAVLQNLFFATLNTEIDQRSFSDEGGPAHSDFNEYRYRNLLSDPNDFVRKLEGVPFINGGLFDCLDDFSAASADGKLVDAFIDNPVQGEDLRVPTRLFLAPEDGLFALFRRYKFTIEESTPLDREVALDPELLGRAFENLLGAYNPETRETARKKTGSYYTPRPVVDYMVREALTEALAANSQPADGDATFWRDRLQYLLDHSDAMNDADELFEEADKRAIMTAIAKIRTLDPAVGSGAFPMGILQTLTLALRRLDPDNALWEEIQKERAKARAGEAFDTREQSSRDEALREISAMFEKYRQSDFGRKLYLIQNGIYGVDIQPIACQIVKLRFFISLVIEQDSEHDAPNLGIKPLPNLETRLVAADTLIGLKTEAGSLLLNDAVVLKRKEVVAVRERYFLADSRPRKLQCVKTDKYLRNELQNILETERRNWIAAQEQVIESKAEKFPNADVRKTVEENERRQLTKRQCKYDEALTNARMIAKWDPYDQNARAGWFGAEYMFGVSDDFDVVIGNPPYIQLQKNGGCAGKLYRGAGYETFQQTGDIYQLFYERGCGLLKPRTGVLAYITSNSWLKAEYGKPLRQWFAKRHMPLQLIEMGKNVFENAIVDTAVLIIRNGNGQHVTCRAVDVEHASDDRFPPPKGDWGTLQPKGDRPWMALSSVERAVMEKMESVGTPLKHW